MSMPPHAARYLAAGVAAALAAAWLIPTGAAEPHLGLSLLLEKPLSVAAMTEQELGDLWQVWNDHDREQAAGATRDERRRLVYARYGLIERGPTVGRGTDPTLPLGYTPDRSGNLYPNCLACHGGRVAGRVVPGLANNEQDLAALVDDLTTLRAQTGGGGFDVRGMLSLFPLNLSRGSTNATMYSILLAAMRDADLNQVMPPQLSQPFVHNTIDAPAWWQFHRKDRIYCDGMAPKTTRTLMQFTMAPGLDGATIRSWEDEFETIRSYIASIEAPPYPFRLDRDLAAAGRAAFERVCAECHGTYGEGGSYPNRTVPIAVVGTDPVRLRAIHPASKERYNRSWFSNYGEHPVSLEERGYVAPPLDGVWATAPYLHNGSVPTLWHLLHPDERPQLWRRVDVEAYDTERVGLTVRALKAIPDGLDERGRRQIYDTGVFSQSADGHRFPDRLTSEERRAVLEYLKSL